MMTDEPENGALAEVEAPTDAPEAEAAPAQTVEEFAEEMGWVPKEKYSGPEGKWKPAKDWIKFDREMNRDLKKKVDRINDQLERQAEASTKQMGRALEMQAAQIRAEFEQSVKAGDTKGAADAADRLANLRDEAPKERDYVAEFSERNTWYGSNRKATALANLVSAELGEKGISKAKQLEMIEAEVRKEFPDLFGDAPKKPHAAVSAPSMGRASRSKGPGDLPPDAKKAMESSIRMMTERFGSKINADEERKIYARDYWQLKGEEAA